MYLASTWQVFGFQFLELLFILSILGESILGAREKIFPLGKYLTSLMSKYLASIWQVLGKYLAFGS